MQCKRFLATTAIEDFWSQSGQVVFLGEWCLRYTRQHHNTTDNIIICTDSWVESNQVEADMKYLAAVFEKVIGRLAAFLNKVHGVNFSNNYWRILLGAWLLHYLDTMFDRYLCVKKALNTYPDIETIGLSETSFVTPKDTLEFFTLIADDPYNLQLYTRVLEYLDGERIIDYKPYVLRLDLDGSKKPYQSNLRNIISKGAALVLRFFPRYIEVVLHKSYIPKSVLLELALKSRGKVWFLTPEEERLTTTYIDSNIRAKWEEHWGDGDEFEKLISRLIMLDLPLCFVENYSTIAQDVGRIWPKNAPVIFSGIGWYFDETFKQWAGQCSENGSTLIGAQHGGNYGSVPMSVYAFERSITHGYFTWGWGSKSNESGVVPFLCSKALSKQGLGADNDKRGILYTTSGTNRYIYRISARPHSYDFLHYMRLQYRFLRALPPRTFEELVLRLNIQEGGWDRIERLRDRFPNLLVENVCDRSFGESLSACRLYVADHLSTTFIEALVVNKPTVLFWDPQMFPLTNEAKPVYEELNKAGILHFSPEDAATTAIEAYQDVEGWWAEPQRVKARQIFCDEFARMSSDPASEWLNAYKEFITGKEMKTGL